jgi:hypothetical protein
VRRHGTSEAITCGVSHGRTLATLSTSSTATATPAWSIAERERHLRIATHDLEVGDVQTSVRTSKSKMTIADERDERDSHRRHAWLTEEGW